MNTKSRIAAALCLLSIATTAACLAEETETEGDVEQPVMTFEEFRDSVYQEPWEGGLYIVDGDMPMTEDDLRLFYEGYVATRPLDAESSATPEHEGDGEETGHAESALTLNQVPQIGPRSCWWDGPFLRCSVGSVFYFDDIWTVQQKMNLSFCISNNFGVMKETVANAMQTATRAWENVAGVRFVYRPEQDASCDGNNNNVVFHVTQVGNEVSYLARAFFPHMQRSERSINVRANHVDDADLVSTMMHELGHTLGFRHEHIRAPGTVNPNDPCRELAPFRPVTGYDSSSIMHYEWCPGASSTALTTLTQSDAQGAATLYGSASPRPACAHNVLVAGAALDGLCSQCVSSVCSLDSFCCSGSWDGYCIDEVSVCL